MREFVLVGAGGTASYLMPALHRWLLSTFKDDFTLLIIDGDVVENGNLTRQNHTLSAVGKNKAEALREAYPQHTIAIKTYLSDKNIDKVIKEGSTVLITVDNWPCRKRIETHAATLQDVVVINAGNELYTGSVQVSIRQKGKDITPPMGFLHPEITNTGEDRAKMTCAAVAALPGGGQTAIANQATATFILLALNMLEEKAKLTWHEFHFDAAKGILESIDYRETKAWKNYSSS